MKIKYRKNRIRIQGKGSAIPYLAILAAYISASIYLSALFPFTFPYFLLSFFLLLNFRKNINITAEQIEITPRGITFSKGLKTKKFIARENINTLYIQNKHDQTEFYINNKERVEFNISNIPNLHSLIQKMKHLLKVKISNEKKIFSGKIYEFVSNKIIDEKKNHIDKALIDKGHSGNSKSHYYNIESIDQSLVIKTINTIEFLNRDTLIIDRESNSLKIHFANNIPDEISFHQITNIEVSVKQNASGEKGDLIQGKLILVTDQFEPITIFQTNVKEKNQLDFTSDQIKKDLIALKAIIEFEIFSVIDQKIETLDLQTLKEKVEKQKDILPNSGDSML